MPTAYYISFTDSQGQLVTLDGGPLYAISAAQFQALVQVTSNQNSGVGVASFTPLTLTLGPGALSTQLDQLLATGAVSLRDVDVFAVDTSTGALTEQLEFKSVQVFGDSVDLLGGSHAVQLQYASVVETYVPPAQNGPQQQPVVQGWNNTKNIADSRLDTGWTSVAPGGAPSLATPPAYGPTTAYVRITNALGNAPITSANGGWIALDAASYQALANGTDSFGALSLRFAPGSAAATLLVDLAKGQQLNIEVAVESSGPNGPVLQADYRFAGAYAALASETVGADPAYAYQFDYTSIGGTQYFYGSDGSLASSQSFGWNQVANSAAPTLPAQQATPTHLPTIGTQAAQAEQFYVSFTDQGGNVISLDGGPLHQITAAQYSALQSIQLAVKTTVGQANFQGLTFTLGSSALTSLIDQMLEQGQTFGAVDLYAVGASQQLLEQDEFQDAFVAGDDFDPATGQHNLSFGYQAVVQSVPGAPAIGWSVANNNTASSLTTSWSSIVPAGASPGAYLAQQGSGTLQLYVQIKDVHGNNLLGAGHWAPVIDAASGMQSSGGAPTFGPLTLELEPGILDPKLLAQMAGAGVLQIELAAYDTSSGVSTLVDDYQFATGALSSLQQSSGPGGGTELQIVYGQTSETHYAAAGATSTSWAGGTSGSTPLFTPAANRNSPPGSSAYGGEDASTRYYISFTGADGQVLQLDGGPLYALSQAQFEAMASVTVSTRLNAGRPTFGALVVDLGSSALAVELDQLAAAGTPLQAVDIFAVNTDANGQPIVLAQDEFKQAAVSSDVAAPASGGHEISFTFGSLVESRLPSPTGGQPVIGGYSMLTGLQDTAFLNTYAGVAAAGGVVNDGGRALKLFVRIATASNGPALSSTNQGWIAVDGATWQGLAAQTQVAAGQVSTGPVQFSPLTLAFDPAALGPRLLQLLATGGSLSLELAAVDETDPNAPLLVDDYVFGKAVLSGATDGVGVSNQYSFSYSQLAETHYGSGSTTSMGWDTKQNAPVTGADLGQIASPAYFPATGQSFTLTRSSDVVVGMPGDNTVIAPGYALTAGDQISAGPSNANVLELQGGGTFDLRAPASLTGIATIVAREGQWDASNSQQQVLWLRDGMAATVNVESDTNLIPGNANPPTIAIHGGNDSDVINLGSGQDAVFIGSNFETVNGGGGTDIYYMTAATEGATIHGVSNDNRLYFTGGGAVAMGAQITGVTSAHLVGAPAGSTQPDYVFTASAIQGLGIYGSDGNDTITVGDASQHVQTGSGTSRVILTAATAGAPVVGGAGGTTTLELQGGGQFVLNAATQNLTAQLDAASVLTLTRFGTVSVTSLTGGNRLIARSNSLGAGASIALAGANTLDLTGGGLFDLTRLSAFSGITTIDAQDGQWTAGADSQLQKLYMRSGVNVTLNVASDRSPIADNPYTPAFAVVGADDSDVFNLGDGQDTVYLGSASETVNGGAGNDQVFATAATAGALLKGGSGYMTLNVSGGGAAAMNAADTAVQLVRLQASASPFSFTANGLSGLQVYDLSSGPDSIVLGGANQLVTGGGAGQLTMTASAAGHDYFKDAAALLNGDTIVGFGAASGNTLDVTDMNSARLVATFSENAAGTAGVLTLTDGTHTAAINLMGQFAAAGFNGSAAAAGFSTNSDGGVGTTVTWHAITAPH